MNSTYTHPLLRTWLPSYLRGHGKSFQSLSNLPQKMRSIAEEQDDIGWTNFAEGRVTKRIRDRDIQRMYMCNRNVTYMVHHWMRDFVRTLIGLAHEVWLGRTLMEHHKTKGVITISRRRRSCSAKQIKLPMFHE